MTEEICALEALMVEDGDLELFPDEVVERYKRKPAGPRQARALLARAMKTEKDPARKAKQKKHHDDYRLWMVPVDKAPSTGTINGIGVRMYGRAANDFQAGTYVSTLWFTLVYLPIFPLGSYLCSDGDGGSYYVHGQVHQPRTVWVPPLIFGGLFGALLFAGIAAGIDSALHARVILYNGFPRPAEVVVEGEGSWTVPPNGHRAVRLPAEDLVATTTVEGMAEPLETVDLPLSGASFDETVYNLGGVGVLAVYYIVYGDGDVPETQPIYDVVSQHDDLFYQFTEPPEQISTKSNRVVRSILDAEMVDAAIYQRAMALTMFTDDADLGWRMADAALRAGDGDPNTSMIVFGMMPEEEHTAYCERLIAAQPHSVDARRTCQSIAMNTDLEAERARAKAEAEANPDSAVAQYLYGRVLRGDEAIAQFRKATALDRDLLHAHAAMAYALEAHPDELEEALAHAEVSRPLNRLDIDNLELRIRRRMGATATELAQAIQGRDESTYTTADMFRLQADPALYEGQLARITSSGADWAAEDLANVQANIALIAGRIDDLRSFNANGGGLGIYLALSDGASAADRDIQADPAETSADRAILYWLLARQTGGDVAAWESNLDERFPRLLPLLREPRTLTVEKLREAMEGEQPAAQATANFAAYRLTAKPAFGKEAKLWAMPPDLPYFQLR